MQPTALRAAADPLNRGRRIECEMSTSCSGPIYLCRCGQSANKPFCDSTHRKVKFEAPAAELTIG